MSKKRLAATLLAGTAGAIALAAGSLSARGAAVSAEPLEPTVSQAVAFDATPPLREMPPVASSLERPEPVGELGAGPVGNKEHSSDEALQTQPVTGTMPRPLFTFEGPSNEDNFRIFGFRVNPPDPNGDVGPGHVVFMVNLVFSVYSKSGKLLGGPFDTGTLWQGFEIDDCTDPSGDPIVVYDEKADRWILTQFTTRGFDVPGQPFFNCVAVSQTPDPLGPYFRFAFETGQNFPDYPKYGVWPSADPTQASLTITTREFNRGGGEDNIGIFAIERAGLLAGDPNTRIVEFHLKDQALRGDGLLPADFDGRTSPPVGSPQVILGTQDDGAGQGVRFDALNVFHLRANFADPKTSTFGLAKQLPIANFDTIFPCTPTSRDCIPQPGIFTPEDPRKLDILSYRQRPTWRLQYRNFGTHETLVTNQSVEARPAIAGVRWWELRNPVDPVIHQEGTWAPDDNVHRWMGSVALDKNGNLAVGYSVSSHVAKVFPGIRYAGRLVNDPLGELSQGEAVLQNGKGVQTATNSRWGDYTSMNVDPVDDCTFYYFNEYYQRSGTAADPRPWRTRVGAFRFPDCI